MNFHSLGVCACTALKWLYIRDSIVGATQDNETLGLQTDHEFQIPDSITSLTSLVDVKVFVEKSEQSYHWLYSLTTLTSLYLHVSTAYSEPAFTISNGLTKLQRLRSLVVTGACAASLDLQVKWNEMQHLKVVRFMCNNKLACDDRILLLAQMKSLLVLELAGCLPSSVDSVRCMVLLAHGIALHKPNITFIVRH